MANKPKFVGLSLSPRLRLKQGANALGGIAGAITKVLSFLDPVCFWRPDLLRIFWVFTSLWTLERVVKYSLPPFDPNPQICVGIPIPWVTCLGWNVTAPYLPGAALSLSAWTLIAVVSISMALYGYLGAASKRRDGKIDATRISLAWAGWYVFLALLWTTW